jgi:ribonuclease HI
MDSLAFTDGACSGNPGPGGWGTVILRPDGSVAELGGGEARTTNNRMELSAVIAAVENAPPGGLKLYADSTYVITGINDWIGGWKRRGWVNFKGEPVANRDLWEKLDAAVTARGARTISWHYVRGHTGSPGNERCDEIAAAFSKGKQPALFLGPVTAYSVDLLDVPADTTVPKNDFRKAGPKRAGGFYVSLLAGKAERHTTWADCQARVNGQSGARFKKVFTPEEEKEALRSWGAA